MWQGIMSRFHVLAMDLNGARLICSLNWCCAQHVYPSTSPLPSIDVNVLNASPVIYRWYTFCCKKIQFHLRLCAILSPSFWWSIKLMTECYNDTWSILISRSSLTYKYSSMHYIATRGRRISEIFIESTFPIYVLFSFKDANIQHLFTIFYHYAMSVLWKVHIVLPFSFHRRISGSTMDAHLAHAAALCGAIPLVNAIRTNLT